MDIRAQMKTILAGAEPQTEAMKLVCKPARAECCKFAARSDTVPNRAIGQGRRSRETPANARRRMCSGHERLVWADVAKRALRNFAINFGGDPVSLSLRNFSALVEKRNKMSLPLFHQWCGRSV
jgi:hypothetical protein